MALYIPLDNLLWWVSLSLDALSVLKCNSNMNFCEDASRCYFSTTTKKKQNVLRWFRTILQGDETKQKDIKATKKQHGILRLHYFITECSMMWIEISAECDCCWNAMKINWKCAKKQRSSIVNAYVYTPWFKKRRKKQ